MVSHFIHIYIKYQTFIYIDTFLPLPFCLLIPGLRPKTGDVCYSLSKCDVMYDKRKKKQEDVKNLLFRKSE
jgi:hypothetical protein